MAHLRKKRQKSSAFGVNDGKNDAKWEATIEIICRPHGTRVVEVGLSGEWLRFTRTPA